MTKGQQAREMWETGEYEIAEIATLLEMHYSHVHASVKGATKKSLVVNELLVTVPFDVKKIRSLIAIQNAGKLRITLADHLCQWLKDTLMSSKYCRLSIDKQTVTLVVVTNECTPNSYNTINQIGSEIMEVLYQLTDNVTAEFRTLDHIYHFTV
jgi:hypothetical protein